MTPYEPLAESEPSPHDAGKRRRSRPLLWLLLAVTVVLVTGRLYGPRFHSCDVLSTRAQKDLDAESYQRFQSLVLAPLESRHHFRTRPPRHVAGEVVVHYLLDWDQTRDHETCTNLLTPAVYTKVLDNMKRKLPNTTAP